MKQFRVPCHFGLSGKLPFPIYVGEPNPENHPLKYQADWLRRERGGSIPKSVLDSLKRLQTIAIRSHVSFEDLCAYAIGQSRKSRTATRPPATLEEAAAALPANAPIARMPLQVIHNPEWETRMQQLDNEQAKLPQLALVSQRNGDDDDEEIEMRKPARKPKPGVELEPLRRRVPTDRAELEKYPFRHLYDWLRTKPAMGFAEIQSLVSVIIPAEREEEQVLLATLMLEETQSVLLPHSFAETLDFLFHYEDLHYSIAVVLDTGAQYLSRSTFGNLLHFYQMPKSQLDVLKRALNHAVVSFATSDLPKDRLELAPENFDLKQFHKRCRQWFTQYPQAGY